MQCPGFKFDNEGKPDPSQKELFADEARYFTESRLLQRDVQVVLESVNNSNFIGSIIHPVSLHTRHYMKHDYVCCLLIEKLMLILLRK